MVANPSGSKLIRSAGASELPGAHLKALRTGDCVSASSPDRHPRDVALRHDIVKHGAPLECLPESLRENHFLGAGGIKKTYVSQLERRLLLALAYRACAFFVDMRSRLATV